ncbi:hypothetical protein EKK58_02590 [Candidatus Dependentiae bacterium]|nr:MAG: hypothetical protein EKK58_02590 [Candidatus Dependentiae bacterium]
MNKKLISALSLALLISILPACGKKDTKKSDKKIHHKKQEHKSKKAKPHKSYAKESYARVMDEDETK